jgi:glycosyltransferase involved in cell wall biosynthesis
MLRDSFPNGGAERQLALLASSLPKGIDVCIWGMGDGPFVPVLRELDLPVELSQRKWRLDPSPVAGLRRLVRSWRPDVLHTWGWMSAAAALPVAAACRVPVVDGTIRNARVDPRFVVPRRMAMRAARLVVANSHAGLRAWRAEGARGRVVYNGFDARRLARLQAASDPAAAAGPRPFTVVMTGRMKPAKDFTSLVAAARLLTAEGDGEWLFVLAGVGEDRPKLERQATTLMRAGVLSFVDADLEVLDHVRPADAGVLLTNARVHAEGCSNSLLEYMACSLPVVCSDSGGNREVVEDGVSGFVVPPGDPQAVASSLRRLRDDVELRRRLGARGRARLESDFTVPRMVGQWVGIYEEAAAALRPGRGKADRAWGS